jgi:hypothetical protein
VVTPRECGDSEQLLAKYKCVLESIMPPNYLGEDGFLKTPDGASYVYEVRAEARPQLLTRLWRLVVPKGSKAYGTGAPNLLKILRDNKDRFGEDEYRQLTSIVLEYSLETGRYIDIAYGDDWALPHESFHTIQGYLAEHCTSVFNALDTAMQGKKREFSQVYSNSPLSKSLWAYRVDHMFPSFKSFDFPNGYIRAAEAFKRQHPGFSKIENELFYQLNMNEAIPQLLTVATRYNDEKADRLLSQIFGEAGLRTDFIERKGFWA